MASSFCRTTTHGIVRQVPEPCQTHGGDGDHLRMPPGFRGLNMKAKRSRVGAVVAVAKCAAWEAGFLKELERELEEGGGEGWKRVEKKGMVEVLECLEREAIQGEDHGREPSDYNRRAQIFDHSSRVFQALKESTHPTHSPNS
ncbi:transcription elongation factor s-II [Hibiscus syriacus]|uniref:Transcription elongation factor s-II n=1 Tax=Hibiscus syriacus TaxID=106335 RepID=A0A6A3BQW9_HIBSY|nr:uncharacterized protein LOC120213119 [Hibiscus syriacus]KAE8717818.1 transcription elongation factor s-II [Hibiscus syriacus]